MIRYKEYLQAKEIVDAYEEQRKKSVININDLSINQKVMYYNRKDFYYWVSEIIGEDVLIRTTEKKDDFSNPKYNDFIVNIAELQLT